MVEEKLLSRKKASERLGIHPLTLYRWGKKGKIKTIQTPSGQFLYPLSEVNRILDIQDNRPKNRTSIYGRVSSYDQKQHGDLDRQIEFLRKYAMKNKLLVVDEITDLASGLKTDRRGLKKLFKLVVDKEIDKVIVTYKDRLTRFGLGYLEEFFAAFGVEVIVTQTSEDKTPQEELVADLIEIVTSFRGEDSRIAFSQEQIMGLLP